MQRRIGGRLGALLALAAAAALVGPRARAAGNEGGEGFVFDVTLAPACLDGAFPLRVSTASGAVDGTLAVAHDARGRLTGTLDLAGEALPVQGSVRFGPAGHALKLTARRGRKDALSLRGSFVSGDFAGEARGKGALVPDARTFVLDLDSAAPLVASISAIVEPGKKGRLGGRGTVRACGAPVDLKVSGKDGQTFRLKLKGRSFRFSGTGDHVPGNAALRWSAKGFGAEIVEDTVSVDTVLAPRDLRYPTTDALYETEEAVPPNVPTSTGDHATSWSIEPGLPQGLSFDAATGAISGVPVAESPATRHTVTAANLAGSASAKLDVEVRRNRRYSLARQRDLSDDDIRHFLVRTHWSADDALVADIRARGLPAFVDNMLTFRTGTDWELAATEDELKDDDDPQGIVPNTTEAARWWQNIMMTTEAPFQEALAFFWSDHFAVGGQDVGNGAYMVDYVNLFRREGAGNLRALLLDMARHPAMLKYLNGVDNRRGAPNENFARELWELFTLGVDDGYTQQDIVEASKALTGWRERSRQVPDYPVAGRSVTTYYVEFDPNRHDTGPKTFLGVTVPGQSATDDYAAVVDATLSERDPERFICRKLLAYFALPDPPDELVDALGAVLRDSGWELAPTLRAMFLSEAFFSSAARTGFVKGPVEYGVGFIRSTGLAIRPSTLDSYMNTLGQRPTQPPTVDGWPEGTLWFSAQSMVDRTNLALTVVNDTSRQTAAGIDVRDILPPPGQRSAAEIVDALAARLGVALGTDDRQALVDYMVTERQSNGTVVASPLTDANLDARVRGALYVLAQHPAYHVR